MSDWSRRALLASLGTAVLTGCLSESESPGTEPRETSPGSGEDPASATPTATASPAGTATETESPTPTDTETPATPEPAPSPPESIDSEWSVPAADAGRSKFNSGAEGPTDRVAELWSVSIETTLFGPVVADGSLYVGGDDGVLRAFDARTGDPVWEASVGDNAGRPRVLDGRLFVPTTDAIVALSASDGSQQWRTDTPGRVGRLAATDTVVWLPGMVVADHGVYWLDGDGPATVALSTSDGSQQWRTAIEDPAEGPLFASEDRVFVSSGTHDNRFWRFDPATGETLGEEPRLGADFPAEECYLDGTMYAVDGFFGNVRASAVTDDGHGWYTGVPPQGEGPTGAVTAGPDHVFYTANYQDEPNVSALDRTDGSVDWTLNPSGYVTGRPVAGTETLLVPIGEGLSCFDPADGTERWTADLDVGERPVLVDDVVYAAVDGTVRASRPPPSPGDR